MLNLQLGVIKLLVLGFTVSTVTSSITDVPVLIWGGGSTTKSITKSFNLFDKTSQKDFKDIVAKKVGDSQLPIIVFYRDSFCREDVTLHDTVSAQPLFTDKLSILIDKKIIFRTNGSSLKNSARWNTFQKSRARWLSSRLFSFIIKL